MVRRRTYTHAEELTMTSNARRTTLGLFLPVALVSLVVVALAGAQAPDGPTQPAAEAAGEIVAEGSDEFPAAPMITGGQTKLNLAGAERVLAGARARAAAMNLKVNIAVVDDGGHLLAFARMDGARPASVYTALTKATSAATLRQATGPLPPGAEELDVWLNLSVQNAAAASGGKFTTLYGGVLVTLGDQTIGAVGVGGATGEQDAEIARAGIAALLEAIEAAAM
jgi:glc operon protein GlcG